MKIIDKYLLKRYLATFFVMLFLFIPIGIVIDVSEKINKILQNKVPFVEVALYYLNFTIYFVESSFPDIFISFLLSGSLQNWLTTQRLLQF